MRKYLQDLIKEVDQISILKTYDDILDLKRVLFKIIVELDKALPLDVEPD